MTIQVSSGNVEVTPADAIHTIAGVQFVVKVRNIAGENFLVVGQNHGQGWDEGLFAMQNALPPTGDAKAILTAALPDINAIIAKAAPVTTGGTLPPAGDLAHELDALIQTLKVSGSQLTL